MGATSPVKGDRRHAGEPSHKNVTVPAYAALMTPAQWSVVFSAGANTAHGHGDLPLGAALVAMAAQCRKLHAADNPRAVEPPDDAVIGMTDTMAMPKLTDTPSARIMRLPFTSTPAHDANEITIHAPYGWKIVQVLTDTANVATMMCLLVPDDLPLPY